MDLGVNRFIKSPSLAFIPIYLTCQIKPFANSTDEAKGLFVKGDIGYTFA